MRTIQKYIDPNLLLENPWNSNVMSSEGQVMLENSILRFGMDFRPVVARVIENKQLQIIGGQHRARAAKSLGIEKIPVIIYSNLSDEMAKEIGIVDNSRYGDDDPLKLSELLKSLDSVDELPTFVPISHEDIESLSMATKIDLDSLEFDTDLDTDLDTDQSKTTTPKTHTIIRFKVSIDDSYEIQSVIDHTVKEQGFDEKDSLMNAGDALVHLLLRQDGDD